MNRKGFSLVELIIVIAIMGVLLTVIAPFFLNYLGKSQLAVCRENRDRIKKDMYNELIMFKNNDLDTTTYLDEYMEKGGYKKVSTNTYEGICSTNGVVTFEIDDINSVEAIHISAKCSVHGGDEITVIAEEENVVKDEMYGMKPTFQGAGGGITTTMASAIASKTQPNIINKELEVNRDSYVAISTQYLFDGGLDTNMKSNVLSKDADRLTDYYKKICAAAGIADNNDLYNQVVRGKGIKFVSICTSHTLNDINNLYLSWNSSQEIEITVREYAYLQVELPVYFHPNESGRQDLILYGYRDTTLKLHKTLEQKYKTTVLNMIDGTYDSSTGNPLDVRKSNNPYVGVTDYEEWTLVDLPEISKLVS